MKAIFLALSLAFAPLLRADLTVVQKIEGAGRGLNEITIKMKGDKTRVAMPQAVMIIDGKSGDTLTLLPEQKQIMRISGERMRAMTEMAKQYSGVSQNAEAKAKLADTGKKEMINGQKTEIYTSESPKMKGTYWIATNYPDGAAILRQLQSLQPTQWNAHQGPIPDYRDFPGLPLKMRVELPGEKHFTITLVSIKQDPLAESEFEVPPGYSEMEMPSILGGKNNPSGAGKGPSRPSPSP